MKPHFIVFILLLACQQTNHGQKNCLTEDEVYTKALQFTGWFYDYQADSLSKYIIDRNFSLQDLKNFRKKVDDQLGEEVEMLLERTYLVRVNDRIIHGYVRHSRFARTDRPVRTNFGFDCDYNIYIFEVLTLPQEAQSNHLDYQTKTRLRLPFEGEWYVASGGRSIIQNHHTVAVDQRFACDFLIKKESCTFTNNGARNEDYFCFGEKVLAPGTGKIVEVRNDVTDNKVGEMPENPGNLLIIDHENGEYSVLAHFKQGTVVVKPGDRVKSGQFLGLCGNSGHSSEPHIHYHLQNSPYMFSGEGLPAQFISYEADGSYIELGEPVWGQRIQNR